MILAQRDSSSDGVSFPLGSPWPVFGEAETEGGQASGHYFHQDLVVARAIFEEAPDRHVDVGSRVDGFVAHLAVFRDVDVLDIRPVSVSIPRIRFHQGDLTALEPQWRSCTDSLSCLHALEHVGLGRYGDRIDFDGWRVALDALTSMLRPGGRLYLSVPTGAHQRIEFNAHRVFALPFLRAVLEDTFHIERLAFVHDDGSLTDGVDPWSADADRSFNADLGCSIWFLRLK